MRPCSEVGILGGLLPPLYCLENRGVQEFALRHAASKGQSQDCNYGCQSTKSIFLTILLPSLSGGQGRRGKERKETWQAARYQGSLWVMGGGLMILSCSFLQCACILFIIRENQQYNSIFFIKDHQATLMEPHKSSEDLQQPSRHEKPVPKPTPSVALPKRSPTISKFPSEGGTPRPSAQSARPHCPPHPTFLKWRARRQARRQTFSLTSSLSPTQLLLQPCLMPLWPPRLRMSSTAHPKDLTRDSILLYASQMVCPFLAGLAANYCW